MSDSAHPKTEAMLRYTRGQSWENQFRDAAALCRELEDKIAQQRLALEANRVFHTPIAMRKNGGAWDEYQQDAVNRTREALND